ncbi:hypothetical protein Tco_0823245 [Tanacetum coccineum]|uniref:Uncharacterized protein n=1 Tax=Tanacetum coccineum TaxID=301880 RepID=A0ABQ5AHC9_9ASTR
MKMLTYEEDQGNEAVEDTNTDLDGRDDVMTDVILPQVQATQEIEDNHVTLTPVNPDGQQQSELVCIIWIRLQHAESKPRYCNPNTDPDRMPLTKAKGKYSTSVTKTMAADYGHIKWIEDLVPNSMWSQMIVKYDKFALWGISHWGKKRRLFLWQLRPQGTALTSTNNRIIAVTKVEIVEWQNYKHLD